MNAPPGCGLFSEYHMTLNMYDIVSKKKNTAGHRLSCPVEMKIISTATHSNRWMADTNREWASQWVSLAVGKEQQDCRSENRWRPTGIRRRNYRIRLVYVEEGNRWYSHPWGKCDECSCSVLQKTDCHGPVIWATHNSSHQGLWLSNMPL